MTAPNDPLEFVQDFEPNDDVDVLADAPADPVQDSEGDAVTNDVLPDAGTSSCGRQRKMSRAMAESVSQRDFYGNRNMSTWQPKGLPTDKRKQTSFTILIWNFKIA